MILSIAMMVKNEAKYLKQCLESLQSIRNVIDSELIIVDTGSTDGTVEIAKQFTDKVYFHQWNNNFSEIRNITIKYSTGEWILIIDGDEVISNPQGILQFFTSDEYKKNNTACISIKNYTSTDNEKDFSVLLSPRLFRNDQDFRFEGAVHNQPKFKQPLLVLNVEILHYGYINNDKELMERKFQRTVAILKNELDIDPENIYYLYQLSVSYAMHNDFEMALDPIIKAYNNVKTKKLDLDRYIYIYSQLAKMYFLNGKFREAEQTCLEIVKEDSIYIDLYFYLAKAQFFLSKNNEAIDSYNIYLKKINSNSISNMTKNISIIHDTLGKYEEAYLDLSFLYEKIGEVETALEFAKKIVSNDVLVRGFENIISLYTKSNKFDELRNYFESEILINHIELKDNFLNSLEGYLIKSNKNTREKIYGVFSEGSTEYSLLNRLRIVSEQEQEHSIEMVEAFDFNKLPEYYGDLIYHFMNKKIELNKFLSKASDFKIRAYLNFILNKYDDLGKVIYEYFKSCSSKSELTLDNTRLNKMLAMYILKSNSLDDDQYKEVFDMYLEYGYRYLEYVYNANIIENGLIYSMKDEEDLFLMYMYLAEKIKNDKAQYVRHLRLALSACNFMKKGIEILISSFEQDKNDYNKEFEEYKIKLKSIIKDLINEGNLEEAKLIINEYESIVNSDVEIYSMKAVIAIFESRFKAAEEILKQGLALDSENQDLLYNMSYLMDRNKNESDALEYFCKAKLCKSDSIKVQDIISNLKEINNDNLRVLHGTIEIANQMYTITEGLKSFGVNAKTLNYYPNYLGYKADYTVNVNSFKNIEQANKEIRKLASKMISENDVFHFHFGTSLTLDNSDLQLLKEINKKVIMQHWGSDVRMYSKAVKQSPNVKVKQLNESKIKRHLGLLSKNISDCIVCDYELYEYVKDFYSNIHIIPQCIDLKKFSVKEVTNKKLLIVHAPTNREIKGTDYIIRAIDDLKLNYDFEFKLIHKMSYEEAMQIYKKADIVIDQLLIGSYGLVAIENMALAKPVICFINEHMREKYPKELPIVLAGIDNIKEVIKNLIKNQDSLKEIGLKGRNYVEKYHDINVLNSKLVEIYKKI